jgi:hypothetical protein
MINVRTFEMMSNESLREYAAMTAKRFASEAVLARRILRERDFAVTFSVASDA